MPETKDEEEKRKLKELEGKNIAYYQVLLSAWINTRMERDKTIITLSAAAIALLVTIITTVHIRGIWQYFFAVGAFGGFIIAIWSCLRIYQYNAIHLEKCLRATSENDAGNLLKRFDRLSTICFYVGIACAIFMAILASFQKTGDFAMNDKKTNTPKKVEKVQESLSGIKELSPGKLEIGKSVSGVENLSPQNLQSLPTIPPENDVKPSNGKENPADGQKK